MKYSMSCTKRKIMNKINEVKKAIKRFDSFIITAHINPEGDSIGSQLAMAGLLRSLGKDFVILNSDRMPEHFSFLPEADLIRNKIDPGRKFDAAIVLDCPNLKRTGRVKNTVAGAGFIINIDHHVSNENFGDLNWVAKNASSAGEMVYRIYKSFNRRLTKETALYLYLAILTDTGSFNYSNTSGATHEIISELMGYGLQPHSISQSVYGNKTPESVKLLGRVLSGLTLVSNGKIAYLSVRREDFKKMKAKTRDCEDFVNFARSVRGVYVALFFREDIKEKNVFHVNFRSEGAVDVNKIVAHFGGGGHASASGCTVRGSFEKVKEKILKRVKDAL